MSLGGLESFRLLLLHSFCQRALIALHANYRTLAAEDRKTQSVSRIGAPVLSFFFFSATGCFTGWCFLVHSATASIQFLHLFLLLLLLAPHTDAVAKAERKWAKQLIVCGCVNKVVVAFCLFRDFGCCGMSASPVGMCVCLWIYQGQSDAARPSKNFDDCTASKLTFSQLNQSMEPLARWKSWNQRCCTVFFSSFYCHRLSFAIYDAAISSSSASAIFG